VPNCRRPEAEPVALSLPEALYEESAHRRGAVALAAVLLALTVSSLALVSPPAGEWSSHSRHTAVNVEQLLPEDVLFHVTVPSPAAVRQRLSQSLAQQLLSDPALKPLHTHFENNLEQFAADVRQLSGLTLDELLTLPCPVSISLVPRVDRNPSVVACMRFEKLDPEIDRLLNTVRVRCDRGDMEYSVTQSETTRVLSITSG